VTLHTIHYIDGNPQKGGRMTPRLVGFDTAIERQFFEVFCSVPGLGVKKALRALVRPVRDIAHSIEQQDIKALTTMPGVGAAMAEKIVAQLRRKMAKFALLAKQVACSNSRWPARRNSSPLKTYCKQFTRPTSRYLAPEESASLGQSGSPVSPWGKATAQKKAPRKTRGAFFGFETWLAGKPTASFKIRL